MNKTAFLTSFLGIGVLSFFLYRYIEEQNQVTTLLLTLPQLEKSSMRSKKKMRVCALPSNGGKTLHICSSSQDRANMRISGCRLRAKCSPSSRSRAPLAPTPRRPPPLAPHRSPLLLSKGQASCLAFVFFGDQFQLLF